MLCISGQPLQHHRIEGKTCSLRETLQCSSGLVVPLITFWQNWVEVLMLQNRPSHFIWHNALHSRASLAFQGKPCISGQALHFKARLAVKGNPCRQCHVLQEQGLQFRADLPSIEFFVAQCCAFQGNPCNSTELRARLAV
jgi:hypothetical protein